MCQKDSPEEQRQCAKSFSSTFIPTAICRNTKSDIHNYIIIGKKCTGLGSEYMVHTQLQTGLQCTDIVMDTADVLCVTHLPILSHLRGTTLFSEEGWAELPGL